MVRLFVRHDVQDYDKWRQGYDDNARMIADNGVRAQAVYRSVDDGNNLTVSHDFDSIEAARSFAGSDELKTAMQALGVVGHPEVWFVEQA
ncbi:MAG: cyclase [Actinomycetes bacterium]